MTQDAIRTALEAMGFVVPFGPIDQRPGRLVWLARPMRSGLLGLRLGKVLRLQGWSEFETLASSRPS